MKLLLPSIPLLLLTTICSQSTAQDFRTDINPALLYYQAFALSPELSKEDHAFLFTREWRNEPLEERFGELIHRYDNSFKLIRQAWHSKVPCEWGIDLTRGPETLLPGLARAKHMAQVARVRALWHLQEGQQTEARDDLLAAFALCRNVSKDGVVISAMVQMAIENIIGSMVAENFYRLNAETLQQLADGFDAAPARGTIAQCIPVEKSSVCDWYVKKIQRFQKEHPGNEPKVQEEIRRLFQNDSVEENPDPDFADKVFKAGGGASDGVLNLFRELEPLYQEAFGLLTLPYPECRSKVEAFTQKVRGHPNPLAAKFLPIIEKCRKKEIGNLVKLAMLRAGVEYKLHGEQGLKSVTDPCGTGPFAFRRFVFEGIDRGFELKSQYHWREWDEVLIFDEKGGTPFRVDFMNAGKRQ